MKKRAMSLLQRLTGNASAQFHRDQWESIDALVNNQKQILVVQRTGWGKSAVYFIAAKIRREQGYGRTLIVSPLIALIRNQIEAALALDLKVISINSTMLQKEREQAKSDILNGLADVIIITPEQLAPSDFSENILSKITSEIGMIVVNEAHCISDWGHDFRPDYKRISRLLQNLPDNMPVIATTATANDRVIKDIKTQLGERLQIIRGPLIRETLQLQNLYIRDVSKRLAWLVKYIPSLKGTGIIYVKTVRDCNVGAGFLRENGINANAYHSSVDGSLRESLEQDLIQNKLKVLVATSALGMGFDKPDLGFVIHFQAPGNVIEYYQQVGRAGRSISYALGVMMLGEGDNKIQEFFIKNAFPKQQQVDALLEVLENHDGLKLNQILSLVNLTESKIKNILKYLSIENPSPILENSGHYYRTGFDYALPEQKIKKIEAIKKAEWETLLQYHKTDECLMYFLGKELDDPYIEKCGKCANCAPENKLSEYVDEVLIDKARDYLRHRYIELKPRSNFGASGALVSQAFEYYKFPYRDSRLKCESGLALSSWKDGGWGDLVAEGKINNEFSDKLITPMVKMINSLEYEERPTWLTYVPSLRHPNLVKSFAEKLAEALCVPCIEVLYVSEERPPQKTMENSFYQSKNLDGAFEVIEGSILKEAVWLIDDAVDSQWTFTVSGALLRQYGVSKVYPMALTSTKKNA
ncbi:RecQ family ATP-dependent DNA helicase [Oligella urethralis]|uniref:RecQ family ATP-dependent DNA helicase n=1 Tax=Oligella urethralis TaxID=90245 RepID=UPI00035D9393|nr:RecQ family ATP-dependent DNA helicase [Oligella urethralis]SUA63855.1 ATP-dependent DNA helicase recQ [Oligella urethralis]